MASISSGSVIRTTVDEMIGYGIRAIRVNEMVPVDKLSAS